MKNKTSHINPNWVRGPIITEAYGFTQDGMNKKRQRGHWQEGIVWVKAPDGNMMYSPKAIEEWALNG